MADNINYEIAKSHILELMIINPRISVHSAYKSLDEAGIWKTENTKFSKKLVKEMMDEIREEWAQESFEQRKQARSRQLREIQLIKARLHEQGDYKTLERYLRLEKDLLGTDTQDEREDTRMMLEAQTRIRALELARQQEQLILEQSSSVKEVNYLEVIDD